MDVTGKNVVVTGVIAGESRTTAEAKLQDAGARVQRAVSGSTDVLVTGAKVGKTKIAAAEKLGVAIVSWEDVFGGPGSPGPAGLPPAPLRPVRTIAPMLAKAASELPAGGGWLYEVKWDGYRGVATVVDGAVAIQSRSGKSDYAEQFPQVAAALAGLPDCVLDGELVVLDSAGDSSFETIHRNGAGASCYVVFDALEALGQDVRDRSLLERRDVAEQMVKLADSPLVALSPSFEDGQELLAVVAERRLEGIVAKRVASPYREGTRTDAWLKIKIRCEQEFVVAGWTPGEGARAGHIGALLLAVNNDAGVLELCGKVGTGGTVEEWDALQARLEPTGNAAFFGGTNGIPKADLRSAVWVKPDVVVQVRFQRWTEDGRLWHPSLQGVREDKNPNEVVREEVGWQTS